MGYIPPGAKWFLADLVMAINVQGAAKVVVHINTTLVGASSAEQAFSRAMTLGRSSQIQYKNLAGKRVRIRFVGIRELNVIHDDLQHGAELTYRERLLDSIEETRALTAKKKRLAVFRPRVHSAGPDYASGDVLRELAAQIPSAGRRVSTRPSTRRRRAVATRAGGRAK